jgi:hypothetical protein
MSSRAKKKWGYRQHGINQELKRKLMSSGVVDAETAIDLAATGQQKMSKVLLDFVAPFSASVASHEEFKKLVLIGLAAWNIALLPAGLRKESLNDLIVKAVPADTADDFQKIIDQMVERKEKYFAENRRFILAHHWTMNGREPHLSVVSTTG